jgi:UDP:flavonoid glycosyltransferase YjiC (YdhE family)
MVDVRSLDLGSVPADAAAGPRVPGVGRADARRHHHAVAAGERNPDVIRDAVRRLLAEPSYGTAAEAFQAEMMALPGPETMVGLLESLATRISGSAG